jgi:hypothetical protein
MAVDDLIWATTSGGSGRMGGACAMLAPTIACVCGGHSFDGGARNVSWARSSRQARHVGGFSAGSSCAMQRQPTTRALAEPPPAVPQPSQHRNTKHETPARAIRSIAFARPLRLCHTAPAHPHHVCAVSAALASARRLSAHHVVHILAVRT